MKVFTVDKIPFISMYHIIDEFEDIRMTDYFNSNQQLWEKLTAVNVKSRMYDVAGFKQGKTSLKELELTELGDVKGKSLLHLQCHFGLDTMSWARLGAEVTGVDFSPLAIRTARELAKELQIKAEFINSALYDLPQHPDKQFDIVYTSYGVLCWLPDLEQWGKLIVRYLKPGGTFYIVEGHPILSIFDNETPEARLEAKYPYFHSPEPMEWTADCSYADGDKFDQHPSYEWTHSLADIVNALISNGLRLQFLHEFPYCVYAHFPWLEQRSDGWFYMPQGMVQLPLTFSIKATKL
jgi:ubiquinone/menaquinone biosynthesis C-methylase UbiE